ncbi:4'-phosphopantetheinyl transferase superfamily protein [Jiella sp. MQZ9-1]|uniref:4'-phosphopantetheinyl transferase superfamily protein n=1 Tax=Jiella flava TaxID=2816857 RepID=UPI001A913F98|nr:4'-phosphopantetheinyl transferase superfamily protein [Jiella flava]
MTQSVANDSCPTNGCASDRDRVDVYLADPALATGETALAWLGLLSSTERARYDRFKVEGARREYLTGRALVRTTLSRHADCSPADWRFEANRYGRPAIAPDQAHAAPGLVFNLSHTRGLVALAIGRNCDLGVDVEWIDRQGRLADLCTRYFAPSETAFVHAAEDDELTDRFFTFWTLKEAYIKARGMGLALPLDGFAYDVSASEPTIRFEPTCPDDPSRWRFFARRIGASHRLALAMAVAGAGVVSVCFWQARPLVAKPEAFAEPAVRLAAPGAGTPSA